MYIDSHVHFWQPSRIDYGWLKPENELLYQDYLPAQLLPELTELGVKGLVAVQAAFKVEEAEFLLELAQTWPVVSGVSGGLDPFADDFHEQLESLKDNPRFSGIRLNGDAFSSTRPVEEQVKLRSALVALMQADLTLDLLIRPEYLSDTASYLEELPLLKAVVNHLGCPNIKEQQMDTWQIGMERLSRLPGVAVKLSGMITMAGGSHPEKLRPYVDQLVQLFGIQRLLFGSDWPVALQAGGYRNVIELFEAVLPEDLTEEEKGMIRMGNASRFYPILR